MSRNGNGWDNAVAELVFSSLKQERIKKHIYPNRELARAEIADYIDNFYNRTRRHSHLAVSVRSSSRLRTSVVAVELCRSRKPYVSTEGWELQADIEHIGSLVEHTDLLEERSLSTLVQSIPHLICDRVILRFRGGSRGAQPGMCRRHVPVGGSQQCSR